MEWIESHKAILWHRKTGRLMRALSISRIEAVGYLHAFWWWCTDNAPAGDLSNIDAEDIADGALWEGDPRAFFDGLVFAGWIDTTEGVPIVHDWMEHMGKLIERRKADAERKRNTRLKLSASPSAGHPPDIRRTADVPYPTVPYPTIKKIKSQDKPATEEPKQRFDYKRLWALIEADQEHMLTWSFPIETKAVQVILRQYPETTPDDLATFIAYKRTCFGIDPASQPSFSKHKGDYPAWVAAGMPVEQEQAARKGNGTRATEPLDPKKYTEGKYAGIFNPKAKAKGEGDAAPY